MVTWLLSHQARAQRKDGPQSVNESFDKAGEGMGDNGSYSQEIN